MAWTNTISKEQVADRPATLEINGVQVPTQGMTDRDLKQYGWYELKPLIMGSEVINPQWQ